MSDLSAYLNEAELKQLSGGLQYVKQKQADIQDKLKPNTKYEITIPNGFYTVRELKDSGTIREEYWNAVPDVCDCTANIIANKSLTILRCSNLRCTHCIASSIEKLAKEYSIAGIGGTTAFNLVMSQGYSSILDFLEKPPFEYSHRVSMLKAEARDYANCVKMIAIPTMKAQALTIFKGINSYDEYLKMVEHHGGLMTFVKSRVGGDGVQAMKLAEMLTAYDYELQNIERVFSLRKEAKHEMFIAMTGNIKSVLQPLHLSKMTKAEYLNLLNNMHPDLVTFRKTESVDKASVVIADYVSTSSKYRAGASKGKLFTSLEFLCEVLNREKLEKFLSN